MKSNYKVILANALIRNGNRGCVALTISSMYLIQKILNKKNAVVDFYLMDSGIPIGYEFEKDYQFELGDIILRYRAAEYPQCQGIRGLLRMLASPIVYNKKVQLLKNADFIFDTGAGDSFADIYGKGRFYLIDKIHLLARKYGKKYFFLPQTIGPFSDSDVRKDANLSLEKSAFVMTRDKQSYDYVVQNVPSQKNVKEYIDVAFFLPYHKMDFSTDFVHVGLNISALLWNGGYTKNNQFGLRDNYQHVITSIIDYFIAIPNVKLHLVAHVVSQERSVENDYAVSYDLWTKYANDRLILAPLFLSPVDAKSYISGLDFFMGARMHATIAAFSSGVPVVPMAYSRKFNGLFEETLDYCHIADMKKDSKEQLLSVISESFNQRDLLKKEIEKANSGIVEDKKNQLLSDLETILLG
jgi:polysaccharide pyruvyl transferase WcaK-like protein